MLLLYRLVGSNPWSLSASCRPCLRPEHMAEGGSRRAMSRDSPPGAAPGGAAKFYIRDCPVLGWQHHHSPKERIGHLDDYLVLVAVGDDFFKRLFWNLLSNDFFQAFNLCSCGDPSFPPWDRDSSCTYFFLLTCKIFFILGLYFGICFTCLFFQYLTLCRIVVLLVISISDIYMWSAIWII